MLWLVAGVTLLRLLYLRFWCPYTLVEDEAHYWEWSRRLEWSYYSKGPGVAWAIAASDWVCAHLGLGVSEFSIRVPSVLLSAVLMVAIAGLARVATGDRRAGLYGAALVALAPAFQFGGMLMTIDVPYAACWGLAAWAGWWALRGGSLRAWVGLGAALGAGVLFKYTILLLIPGIVLWAVAERGRLRLAPGWRAGLGAAVALLGLGLSPVVIWNAQHDWATVHHLLGHLGLSGGDVAPSAEAAQGWRYDPRWTLLLVGSQFALGGLTFVAAIVAAVRAHRLKQSDPEGSADRLYLLVCAAPIFVFYFLVSLVAEPEGTWPLAGHVTLFALGGWGSALSMDEWRAKVAAWRAAPGRRWKGMFRARPETLGHLVWRLALVLGIAVGVMSARADWVAKSAPARLLERELKSLRFVRADRPLMPLGRLMGAGEMAADAARLAGEVSRQTGKEAFVIGQQYGRASLLAYYMPGQPTVYCSSSRSEGRRTQYDMWPQTSLDDPKLLGRPAILVGGKFAHWTPAFESVTEYGQLAGETKKDRLTFIGIGYRGFPPAGTGAGGPR